MPDPTPIGSKLGFNATWSMAVGRDGRRRDLLDPRRGDRHRRRLGLAEFRGRRRSSPWRPATATSSWPILRRGRRRLHFPPRDRRRRLRRQPLLGADRRLRAHQRGLRVHLRPVPRARGRAGAVVSARGGGRHHGAVHRSQPARRRRGGRGRSLPGLVQAGRAGGAGGLGDAHWDAPMLSRGVPERRRRRRRCSGRPRCSWPTRGSSS